jgi:hypothetical protein
MVTRKAAARALEKIEVSEIRISEPIDFNS